MTPCIDCAAKGGASCASTCSCSCHEFKVCPSCAAKPGAPDLCPSCLHNRALVGALLEEVQKRRLRSGVAPNYERLGAELGRLVAEKNRAYGSSFAKSGDVMRILYPDGVGVDQLDDALTVVRILDKLFRVATARDALGESPFRDIGGYALLAQARVDSARGGQ